MRIVICSDGNQSLFGISAITSLYNVNYVVSSLSRISFPILVSENGSFVEYRKCS
jgi:hypothetical protein